MQNKSMIWVVVAAVILIGGGAWWYSMSDTQSATNTQETDVQTSDTPAVTTTEPTTPGTYAMAEVVTHNSAASCWSVIDGNVYDLTQWIAKHPGGERAILGLCGVDGTAAFHGQHDDAKRQADMLATMKIGVLAQ